MINVIGHPVVEGGESAGTLDESKSHIFILKLCAGKTNTKAQRNTQTRKKHVARLPFALTLELQFENQLQKPVTLVQSDWISDFEKVTLSMLHSRSAGASADVPRGRWDRAMPETDRDDRPPDAGGRHSGAPCPETSCQQRQWNPTAGGRVHIDTGMQTTKSSTELGGGCVVGLLLIIGGIYINCKTE